MIDGYYDRFNREKEYERHLFRAGYVLQSAELNELQSATHARIASIGEALFKDGDVIRDARIVVNPNTGAVTCEAGAIYISGAVRGVGPGSFTIPTVGTVAIGVYLQSSVVTELEDPDLRDPASLTRNYQEPGAARQRIHTEWGYDGDGQIGEFYVVYTVEDGQLLSKDPPPNLDAVAQAIARYDVDSAGSNYIVSGLQTIRLEDDLDGNQVYNVKEGRARVGGFGITLHSSRRVVYPTAPVLRLIDSEPHISATADEQRITTDRWPIAGIQQVRITANKTATINHGTFSGAMDPLPDPAVVEIISVKQGETTYTQGTDYKLTSGQVDWSLSGAEPSPGSTYTVEYNYIVSVEPANVDDKGFSVTGAVPGTTVFTTYHVALPRIDRMVLDQNGSINWIQGVSSDYNPVPPQVPANVVPIAQVYQTWDERTRVMADGVRMVSMSDIDAMNRRLDNITQMVAQHVLIADIGTREAVAKKGVFVDPFLDDSLRDQGVEQTGAIVNGALMQPIEGDAVAMPDDVEDVETCDFVLESVLEQPLRTGSMKVNPYMAFGVMPAAVKLTPAVDQWTENQTNWLSDITERFTQTVNVGSGNAIVGRDTVTSSATTTRTISSTSEKLEHLRQIDVNFRIEGFDPGEELQSVTFDGVPVTPTA